MADRIVIMKDGYIQQVGTPAQVYHEPANTFVAQFIGAPSMNMLTGTRTPDGIRLDGGQVFPGNPLIEEGHAVVLGVRPDDLVLGGGTPLLEGQVTVREPLGHETLIYVATQGGEIIAKADGRTPPQVGEIVRLGADPENVHIFDAATGKAVH